MPELDSQMGRTGEALSAEAAWRRLAAHTGVHLAKDELLALFADTIRAVLPGTWVAMRLLGPTGALRRVYATGRLRPEERERLVWIAPPGTSPPGPGFDVSDTYRPIFAPAADGWVLLLARENRALGLLNVEWPAGGEPPASARGTLQAMADHLASLLEGARLVREAELLRDHLHKLLDHAEVPILVADPDRRLRMINRCMERLLGRDRASMVGVAAEEVVVVEDRPRFAGQLGAATRGRSIGGHEFRFAAADGRVAPVLLNFAPVTGRDGEGVESVIGVGQDLSQVRRLQEQMIHAERLATVGQMAAGVVHEINNPLTAVSVHADYLLKVMERQQRTPQELTYMRRIREAADRILHFTQDLMNFARPAGDEPEQIDIAAVIDQAVAFCEHVVARAGVKVERVHAPCPKLYGIRGQLQQVFINLITNACHAMSSVEGERRLTIAVGTHEDGRARLVIADTGPGIPEDLRDRVFEPFYTTKAEGKGTGLGLSIVRNILDKHQAEIAVDEAPGGGARFTMWFYGD
jgi:PAS domain S-box-containing protein